MEIHLPRATKDRLLIGYVEYVDFPDWGVRGLKAKTDTGARTSALHVDNIEELPGKRLRFDVVLHRQKVDRRVRAEAHYTRKSHVRSSSGDGELRYFVKTRIRIGAVEKEIEISLASRGSMRYRMLLGRTALKGDFLIDIGRRYLASERPKKVKRSGRTSAHDRVSVHDKQGAGDKVGSTHGKLHRDGS